MSDPLDSYREQYGREQFGREQFGREQQVGGRVGFGSHPAVLVLDFFYGCMDPASLGAGSDRVIVPRECMGDRESAPHEASLFDTGAKDADVGGSADVLRYLEGLHA
jgi:hypothetical protein